MRYTAPPADPFTQVFSAPFLPSSLHNNISTTALAGANMGHWWRVLGSGVITKIAVRIVASSGNIDVGVYANSGSGGTQLPGAKKTVASMASPGTGYRELALGASVTVVTGDWFYLNVSNVACTFWGAGVAASGSSTTNVGQFGRVKISQTNGTVPDPAVVDTIVVQGWPWMVGVA